MSKIDLSSKIERLEAFEERYAIRIENASAWFDDEYGGVSVLFELHPKSGTTISKNMNVVVVAYNKQGQIIAKAEEYYFVDDFWGFAVSDCSLGEMPLQDISKIRIYPTAG